MDGAFVRTQAVEPNRRGHRPGLFALVNHLGMTGTLEPAEHAFWRRWNDWYEATLPMPPAGAYDRTRHPYAGAWFRATATQFLEPVPGYLAILDAHDIAHETVWSDEPGLLLHTDEFQVVACAGTTCVDPWPLG